MKNKILIGMLLVFVFLFIGNVAGEYTITNYDNSGNLLRTNYYMDTGMEYGDCHNGNDFILQIAPLSCEPKVVTSDLLEENPVTVYCKIIGTKVNPFIDIDSISNIQVTGKKTKDIQGFRYLPSEAALGYWRENNLNDKYLVKDFGYVGITLKQNPNESSMPEVVNGTLKARLDYDIGRAFGVGNAQYYLPVLEDREFENNKERYSFWNGKGYIRLTGIYDDKATVELYGPSSQRIGSAELKLGEESREMLIPGLNPCLATFKVRVNSINEVDTRARLKINSDYIEVTRGEKFLDGRCSVNGKIKNEGINQEILITCKNDEGKNEEIYLKLNPKVSLKIRDETMNHEVGDFLYENEDKQRSVYLGYIGTKGDYKDKKNLFAVLVSIPNSKILPHEEERLSSESLRGISNRMKLIFTDIDKDSSPIKILGDHIKVVAGNLIGFGNYVIEGEDIGILEVGQSGEKTDFDTNEFEEVYVGFNGFAEPVDNELIAPLRNNYTLVGDGRPSPGKIKNYEDVEIENTTFELNENNIKTSPKIFINKEEITLAVFYGNNCKKHSDCESYILKEINKSASKGTIFENVVHGNMSLKNNKKMILESISYEGEEDYLEYYAKAKSDFETLFNVYSSIQYENEQTYGERGLLEAINLADSLGQKETMKKLCDRFRENYPDSSIYPENCDSEYQMANSELNSKEIFINGNTRKIKLEEIYEPEYEEYGAKINIRYSDGEQKPVKLTKEGRYYLKEGDIENNEYIELKKVGEDYATIEYRLIDKTSTSESDSYSQRDSIRIEVDEPNSFKSDYEFTLLETKLTKNAKVTIIPSINYRKSEIDFNYSIGIEKRTILLTDEMIERRINTLNKTVETLEKITGELNKFNKVLGATCLGTGGFLITKNFIQNMGGGGAAARNMVMNEVGGWTQRCKEAVADGIESPNGEPYSSLEDCFFQNADKIDSQVEKISGKIGEINDKVEQIREETGEEPKEIIEKFSKEVYKNLEESELESDEINVTKILNYLKKGGEEGEEVFTMDELRNLYLYTSLYNEEESEEYELEFYGKKLNSSLRDSEENIDTLNLAKDLKSSAGENSALVNLEEEEQREIVYNEDIAFKKTEYEGWEFGDGSSKIEEGEFVYTVRNKKGDNEDYLVVYEEEYGRVKRTYEVDRSNNKLIEEDKKNPFSLIFKKYDAGKYDNKYLNPQVSYYEEGPYKGYPAIMPLDKENGWYVGVKDSEYGIPAYHSSGKLNVVWLCNVGEDQTNDFDILSNDFGGDICEQYVLSRDTNNFPGLSIEKTESLLSKAEKSIYYAQKAHQSGMNEIRIDKETYRIGAPPSLLGEIQCESYMSPKECRVLFNVCDPVICPSSRCDFGGNYRVADVVQTGVIGSTMLCLPNWNEGIYLPVCTTGIQAGLESWTNIVGSYRDCLGDYLERGELTGTCDRVHSIYLCELFWEQATPLAEVLISKVTGIGKNSKLGGGEYLLLPSAWKNAQESVEYFTQNYAKESYKAFQIRNTAEFGTKFCKSSMSIVYPEGKNLFESAWNLIDGAVTPRSPVQYTGNFEETVLTRRTNPPMSHYKVSYYLYSGKDQGAAYQIYLKGESSSYYKDVSPTYLVDSGYLSSGKFLDETKDLSAPSGYNTLCISVNGDEECGFNQKVSTSFTTNYLNDLYFREQVNKTKVTTEKECVSGTASLYSLINPNLQSIADDLLNPDLYNSGITRVCSTESPGKGTDGKWETDEARWRDVGYCGDEKLRCWIDVKTVEDAIKMVNIEKETLNETAKSHEKYLREIRGAGNYISDQEYEKMLKKIENKDINQTERIRLIDEIIEKVFLDVQKSKLHLLRGKSYGILALEKLIQKNILDEISKIKSEEQREREEAEEELGIMEAIEKSLDTYPEIVHKNGNLLIRNLHYRYEKFSEDNKKWQWSKNGKDWYNTYKSFTSDEEELRVLPMPNEENFRNRMNSQEIQQKFSIVGGYSPYVKDASEKLNVDENLIKAIIMQESDAKPDEESVYGAKGLMQVILSGGAIDVRNNSNTLNKNEREKLYENFKDDPFDPETNIMMGTAYYKRLERYYSYKGNTGEDLIKISLLSYNWGMGNVRNNCKDNLWKNCDFKNLPEVSLQYISSILAYKQGLDENIKDYDKLDLSYVSSESTNKAEKLHTEHQRLIADLSGANYLEGIKILVDEIKESNLGGSLETDEIIVRRGPIFEFKENTYGGEKVILINSNEEVLEGYLNLAIKFDGSWLWSLDKKNWIISAEKIASEKIIPIVGPGTWVSDYEATLSDNLKKTFSELEGREDYKGAAIILSEYYAPKEKLSESEDEDEDETPIEEPEEDSIIYKYRTGTNSKNTFYKYSDIIGEKRWAWSFDRKKTWEIYPPSKIENTDEKFVNENLFREDYYNGIKALINRTINEGRGGILGIGKTELITGNATMDSDGIFELRDKSIFNQSISSDNKIYFKMGDYYWLFSFTTKEDEWITVNTQDIKNRYPKLSEKGVNLIKSLRTCDLPPGAAIIFGEDIDEDYITPEPTKTDTNTQKIEEKTQLLKEKVKEHPTYFGNLKRPNLQIDEEYDVYENKSSKIEIEVVGELFIIITDYSDKENKVYYDLGADGKPETLITFEGDLSDIEKEMLYHDGYLRDENLLKSELAIIYIEKNNIGKTPFNTRKVYLLYDGTSGKLFDFDNEESNSLDEIEVHRIHKDYEEFIINFDINQIK